MGLTKSGPHEVWGGDGFLHFAYQGPSRNMTSPERPGRRVPQEVVGGVDCSVGGRGLGLRTHPSVGSVRFGSLRFGLILPVTSSNGLHLIASLLL